MKKVFLFLDFLYEYPTIISMTTVMMSHEKLHSELGTHLQLTKI